MSGVDEITGDWAFLAEGYCSRGTIGDEHILEAQTRTEARAVSLALVVSVSGEIVDGWVVEATQTATERRMWQAGEPVLDALDDLASAILSGGDLKDLASVRTEPDARAMALRMRGLLDRVAGLPIPVVGALNGHALGGGCEIAMACHFRILKETARMGQTESNLGIIPGFGGTQRMPRLIGRAKALEFMILGSQVSAPECLALGLVNRLSKEGTTLDDAKALARQIAKRPPIATRLIIEAVDDGLEAPIDHALEIETRAFIKTLRTEDAAEGIQAFFAKREPEFKGK